MTTQQQKNVLQWIESLESGTYKQGTDYLCNGHKEYCCLGVACELHGKLTRDEMLGGIMCIGASVYMPNEDWFIQTFGFRARKVFSFDGAWNTLPVLNDDKKLSFGQIAQILRDFLNTQEIKD